MGTLLTHGKSQFSDINGDGISDNFGCCLIRILLNSNDNRIQRQYNPITNITHFIIKLSPYSELCSVRNPAGYRMPLPHDRASSTGLEIWLVGDIPLDTGWAIIVSRPTI